MPTDIERWGWIFRLGAFAVINEAMALSCCVVAWLWLPCHGICWDGIRSQRTHSEVFCAPAFLHAFSPQRIQVCLLVTDQRIERSGFRVSSFSQKKLPYGARRRICVFAVPPSVFFLFFAAFSPECLLLFTLQRFFFARTPKSFSSVMARRCGSARRRARRAMPLILLMKNAFASSSHISLEMPLFRVQDTREQFCATPRWRAPLPLFVIARGWRENRQQVRECYASAKKGCLFRLPPPPPRLFISAVFILSRQRWQRDIFHVAAPAERAPYGDGRAVVGIQ